MKTLDSCHLHIPQFVSCKMIYCSNSLHESVYATTIYYTIVSLGKCICEQGLWAVFLFTLFVLECDNAVETAVYLMFCLLI